MCVCVWESTSSKDIILNCRNLTIWYNRVHIHQRGRTTILASLCRYITQADWLFTDPNQFPTLIWFAHKFLLYEYLSLTFSFSPHTPRLLRSLTTHTQKCLPCPSSFCLPLFVCCRTIVVFLLACSISFCVWKRLVVNIRPKQQKPTNKSVYLREKHHFLSLWLMKKQD